MNQSLKTVVLQAFCATGPAALQEAMLALAERIENLEVVMAVIDEAIALGNDFLERKPEIKAMMQEAYTGKTPEQAMEPITTDLNMLTSGPLPNTDTASAGSAD